MVWFCTQQYGINQKHIADHFKILKKTDKFVNINSIRKLTDEHKQLQIKDDEVKILDVEKRTKKKKK